MRRALVLIGLLLPLGCDTDELIDQLVPDAEAPQPVNVQIEADDDTPVSALTPAQRDEACQRSLDAINGGVGAEDKCELAGLTIAISAASEGLDAAKTRCMDSLDSCQTAARVQSPPDVPLDECALFGGDVSTCDLPVSKLEICLTQMASAAVNTLASFSCESLSLDQLADTGFDALGSSVPDSVECAELELKCPGVFKSEGSAGKR
ncbi:hypothetical protein KKF91_20585 [Myxococcota bacterium]|nr:hypothetical protein [Myxococcota bacterium]MBU1432943.1 hypothetical protein [Myxococcota bacterium]MBU1896245.1 hypothetical protein [Myxococcota bacterium]